MVNATVEVIHTYRLFAPSTGAGYVAYKKPDYAHALSRSDTDLLMLFFETYGGWSEPVVRLFRRMQDKVRNKLTKRQYENEVSWSTSTWLALQAQRLSVAVHIASAWEIATEMQLAGGGGEAPSSDEDGAPPRRESTPYFVGPRCVCVCVCVCLCVFVCVLSSRCLVCRPSHLCVCRVGTPPAR